MRSISETVNSMVKCRFGAPLRKRLDSRKETETRLKLVGYLEVLGDVVPHWRRRRGCTWISSQDRSGTCATMKIIILQNRFRYKIWNIESDPTLKIKKSYEKTTLFSPSLHWSQCPSNSRSIYTFNPQLFVAISPLAVDLFCGGTKCVTKCLRNMCKMMKDHPLLHAFIITMKIANGGTVSLCFREHLGYGALILHRITRQTDIKRRCSHTVFWMRVLKESGNCWSYQIQD